MRERRLGTFTVKREMLRHTSFDILARVMSDLVVWHTEARFSDDTLTYHAECEDFEPVPEGIKPPIYDLHVIYEEGVFSHREFRQLSS